LPIKEMALYMAMIPTMADRLAVRKKATGSPVMFQIRKRIPDRLSVDLHEGKTYLGLVPFFMKKVRPRFLPAVPWLSNFLELNVRAYVHDENGRPGVWFFSLDYAVSLSTKGKK